MQLLLSLLHSGMAAAGDTPVVTHLSASPSVIRVSFSPDHAYTVTQSLSTLNHGTSLWESALALGLLLTRAQPSLLSSLSGHTVLELGAGLGLLSCIAARAGGTVTATDLHSVLPYMRATAAANGVRLCDAPAPGAVHITGYAWGSDPAPLLTRGPFDFILGSDIVYSKELVRPLLISIARIAAAAGGKRCTAYVACETRCVDTAAAFVEQAEAWFDMKDMPLKRLGEWVDTSQLHIYCMRLKKGWVDPGDAFLVPAADE